MKMKIIASLLGIVSLLFTSCLEHETTITLNKDGSGTIVEETVFGKEFVGMLAMMPQEGEGAENPMSSLLNKENAAAKAEKYGEGVKFVSVEAIERNGGKGGRATYSFEDINKIIINPNNALADMGDQAGEVKKAEEIKVNYANGKLTLTMPDPDPEDIEKAKDSDFPDEADDPQAAMAMQMMRGMKVSSKLVFPSGIAETNASHREENTVTIMEMDFGQVMENPDGFKSLQKIDFSDRAAASEQLKKLKGVKVETQKEVTIKLK